MNAATKICPRCKQSKLLALDYSLKSDVCKECKVKENVKHKKRWNFGMKAQRYNRSVTRKSCGEI